MAQVFLGGLRSSVANSPVFMDPRVKLVRDAALSPFLNFDRPTSAAVRTGAGLYIPGPGKTSVVLNTGEEVPYEEPIAATPTKTAGKVAAGTIGAAIGALLIKLAIL